MKMDRLFHPNSIVIVGASDKPGMGRGATEAALDSSIKDRVYLLNVKRDEVLGRKCYHALEELPEIPDTIVLCVNVNLVNPYLEQAGKLGVKNAVVYASGFSEDGTEEGRALEKQMADICHKYDMLLVGPNCVGLYNKIDRISLYCKNPIFPEVPIQRGIASVAHSGYINSNLMTSMPDLCAYGVSVGNAAVCSLEEYMLWYASNEHVSCIAAYIEGIKNVDIFEEALRTAAKNLIPVVVMKSGRSAKGSAAAASHTGNLAGDYKTFEALLKRYGVVVTDSLEEFYATARVFAIWDGKLPKGKGIAAVNFSGGENTICADFCEKYNLDLPAYEEKTREIVDSIIPAFSTARNPLDPTTEMFSDVDKVHAMFSAIFEDKNMDMFVLGLELPAKLEMKDKTCVEVFKQLYAEGKMIPSVLVPSFEKDRNWDAVKELQKVGVPMLATGDLAYKIIGNICSFIQYDYTRHSLDLAIPEKKQNYSTVSLSEADSKAEISACGVRVPKQDTASTKDELCEKLSKMGYPVVLKVDSPDILHKTEAGGVVLNIKSESDAVAAFENIMTSCRNFKPDAKINGVLVQEMVPAGTEIIVGIKNDRQYGPMILCGLGGVFVEVFKDAALAPCPVSKSEALDMIESLKAFKLLKGYRGSEPCDIDALCDLMVNLSEYATASKDTVAEIDLNPVFVYPEGNGVVAADALVVKYE